MSYKLFTTSGRSGRYKTEKAWGLLFPLLKARLLWKSMKKTEINILSALQVVFVEKMVRLSDTLLPILVQHVFLFI